MKPSKPYTFFRKPLQVNEALIKQVNREIKAINAGLYPELKIIITPPDEPKTPPPTPRGTHKS
ncbi:MAG TPA: hypothetical protein VN704_04840 [Verrucomicrobiae bacterium]|nr:hypothetical protein [Verrucomicrobiae bacterium]